MWALDVAQRVDPDGEWALQSSLKGDWVLIVSKKRTVLVSVVDEMTCTDLDEKELEQRLMGWLGQISLRSKNL